MGIRLLRSAYRREWHSDRTKRAVVVLDGGLGLLHLPVTTGDEDDEKYKDCHDHEHFGRLGRRGWWRGFVRLYGLAATLRWRGAWQWVIDAGGDKQPCARRHGWLPVCCQVLQPHISRLLAYECHVVLSELCLMCVTYGVSDVCGIWLRPMCVRRSRRGAATCRGVLRSHIRDRSPSALFAATSAAL